MDIKLTPGAMLSPQQREEIKKGFNFIAQKSEIGRAAKRAGLPLVLPKSDVSKLLRACGRAVSPEELQQVLEKVSSPDKGVELQEFYTLFELACEIGEPPLNEMQLFTALAALDLTASDSLDTKTLKDILGTMGDRMGVNEIDRVIEGIPKDGRGRLSCRLIARRLVKGPEGIPHI